MVLRLANTVQAEMDVDYLCLAGGVALNCVANGRVVRESNLKDIWIQPAAGDAGGALGAALAVWHQYDEQPRLLPSRDRPLAVVGEKLAVAQIAAKDSPEFPSSSATDTQYAEFSPDDRMKGSYLGPSFSEAEILDYLKVIKAPFHRFNCDSELMPRVAEILAQGNVVGWFQGRMEFGPRALGGRSIIGDPRSPKMQSVMNLKIKYRESFRPFAPSVLADRIGDYFELDRPSPYMLLVAMVKEDLRMPMSTEQQQLFGIQKLNVPRSQIPAVTHVDYSARIQTVHKQTNPRYYELIRHFETLTGCAVLVNTSFNVRGEPIVCTPEDAYRCFMRTEMDYLVLENVLLAKEEQPAWERDDSWKTEFELD